MEWLNFPWWVPIALLVAAALLVWASSARGERRLLWAAGGVATLAALVFVIDRVVQTPTERAVARTRALVSAVQSNEWDRVRELLDDETVVFDFIGPEQIVTAARVGVESVGLRDARVLRTEADRTETTILVSVSVVSWQAATLDRPARTGWQLDFQDRGRGWRLYRIDYVPDEGGVPEQAIRRRVN